MSNDEDKIKIAELVKKIILEIKIEEELLKAAREVYQEKYKFD